VILLNRIQYNNTHPYDDNCTSVEFHHFVTTTTL